MQKYVQLSSLFCFCWDFMINMCDLIRDLIKLFVFLICSTRTPQRTRKNNWPKTLVSQSSKSTTGKPNPIFWPRKFFAEVLIATLLFFLLLCRKVDNYIKCMLILWQYNWRNNFCIKSKIQGFIKFCNFCQHKEIIPWMHWPLEAS